MRTLPCLIAIILALVAAPGVAEVLIEPVALSGQTAPGTSDGVVFERFSDPVINDNDHIAFAAELRSGAGGVTFDNDQGVWIKTADDFRRVARESAQADDMNEGAVYHDFNFINLSNRDHIGMLATMKHSVGGVRYVDNQGLWAGPASAGKLKLVARKHSHAPDTPAKAAFDGWRVSNRGVDEFGYVITDNGSVAFRAALRLAFGGVDRTNQLGLWQGTPESLKLVARQGFHAPNLPGMPAYIDIGSPVLNERGDMAFRAVASKEKPNPKAKKRRNPSAKGAMTGVWTSRAGSTSLVTRTGIAAPDFPRDIAFTAVGSPDINNRGNVAFKAELSQGVKAVYSDATGGLKSVARILPRQLRKDKRIVEQENDEINFTSFDDPLISDGDHLVVLAEAGAERQYGLWVSVKRGAKMVNVARQNAAAPSGGKDEADVTAVRFRQFGSVMINEAGQVAFLCDLSGADEDARVNRGIYAWSETAGLVPVVKVGDTLPVGDERKHVLWIALVDTRSGGGDGRPRFLSDQGVIVFRAGFPGDVQGIFTATLSD